MTFRPTIEDDSLREGMQAVAGKRLSAEQRRQYLARANQIGVEHIMLGFPAASRNELVQIRASLDCIFQENLSFQPWVLARMNKADARLVARLTDDYPNLGIAVYRSSSKGREAVEGWGEESFADHLDEFLEHCPVGSKKISLNIEDVTRTDSTTLNNLLSRLDWSCFESLALCDTAGVATPAIIPDLVRRVQEAVPSSLRLIWHGHNDLGLAVANSFCAVEAGVSTISGTFLGVGERAGNAALEQICLLLNLHFSRDYKLEGVRRHCRDLQQALQVPLPPWTPVIGEHITSTQAGTHGAAILKSQMTDRLDSHPFLPFAPELLGLKDEIVLGPQSGRSMVAHVLQQLDEQVDEKTIDELFQFCKESSGSLSTEEVIQWNEDRIKHENT